MYDALEEGSHPGKEVFEDTLVNKPTEERSFEVRGGEGCLRLWLWASEMAEAAKAVFSPVGAAKWSPLHDLEAPDHLLQNASPPRTQNGLVNIA